ncbi:MAG: HAMP domain-containing histidine kinase [Desulfobacterales bacterium]|nr:HAMP domain-containing histidine kinase [Desulfobacterales bacterium]
MAYQLDAICESGLKFFGKISASISHEIKNTLAIINENAGLLEDFAFMSEKGTPIDPERIKNLAGKILNQVNRSDDIIKRLNKFAHSIDEISKQVNIYEQLEFILKLYDRFLSQKGITLKLNKPEKNFILTTIPYFFKNLLCLCLDFAMPLCGDNKIININLEKMGNKYKIKFSNLKGITESHLKDFPSDKEKQLMVVLKSELEINANTGEISIYFTE